MEETRQLFVQYLNKYLDIKQSKLLEEQIYNETDEEFTYKQLARLYLNALKRNTWEYNGNLDNAFNLDKNKWLLFREAEETMAMIEAGQVPTGTSMYKCGKCKGSDCTFSTLQTRSSDESESIFITCLNCKHKWKQ